MSVIRNRDGRLEVFARGRWEDNLGKGLPAVRRMIHTYQRAPNWNWSDWASLGGDIHSAPAAGINRDGRLDAFALNYDGFRHSLAHIWQTVPSGGPWSAWANLGGELDQRTPQPAAQADGRIEVFAVAGSPPIVWHIGQKLPNAPPSQWTAWQVLGSDKPPIVFGDPVVARNADGRLEVFVQTVTEDHQSVELRHIFQLVPNGDFSHWFSLGLQRGVFPMGCGRNADGTLELFRFGWDGFERRRQVPGIMWRDWEVINGPPDAHTPIVAQNEDGRLEVFTWGAKGALWHCWQLTPNAHSTEWSEWESLGGILTSDPAVGPNADGRLEVFAIGIDEHLYHIWQLWPNGDWAPWDRLGPAIISRLGQGPFFLF